MSQEDNFDNLIRDKYDEQQFPFTEDKWSRAEEMIIALERRRKRRYALGIFFLGFGTAFLMMLPFVFMNWENNRGVSDLDSRPGTQHGRIHSYQDNLSLVEEYDTLCQNASGSEMFSKTSIIPNDHAPGKRPASKDHRSNKSDRPDASEFSGLEKEHNGSKPAPQDTKPATPAWQNTHTYDLLNGEAEPEIYAMKTDADRIKPSAYHQEPIPDINNQKQISESQSATFNGGIQNENSLRDVVPPNRLVNEEQALSLTEKTDIQNQQEVSNEEVPVIENTTDTVVMVSDTISKEDKLGDEDQVKNRQNKEPLKWKFTLQAGVAYSLGFLQSKNSSEGRGATPQVGIGVQYFFSPKWSVNSGIFYLALFNLQQAKEIERMDFDFGFVSQHTELQVERLHYLMLPLMVSWNCNNKNALSAGGSVAYLIKAKSRVQTYEQNSFGIQNIESQTTGSSRKGFKDFDIAAIIGYRRELYKGLAAELQYYYGFMDIKNDEWFGEVVGDRNMGLRLLLIYHPFEK